MLTKSLSRVALASALIFAFSACGDDSSGTDFDDEATTAETEDAAEGAADLATSAASSLNFGGPNVLLAASASAEEFAAAHPLTARILAEHGLSAAVSMPGVIGVRGAGLQAVAAVGCSVSGHGADGSDPFEPYDGNLNGIPDDWGIKYTCVAKDSSDTSNVVTQTQTIELSVKENTASLHGFDASMDYVVRISEEEGDAFGIEYHGNEQLDIRSSSAHHDYSFRARGFNTVAGETEEESGGESWDATFDPDGSIALGSDLPDGELEFTGKNWFANSDDVSLSFTIDTPEALAYSAACADVDDNPPFTDGQIRGRLNGGSHSASFLISITDCGSYTVEVDNTSDEPVVVSAGYR
jgi:hypothetical protein